MSPRSRRLRSFLATALTIAALTAQDRAPEKVIEVGDKAPPLRCTDASGKALSWDTWKDRAVLVYFHSQDMAFSRQGLEQIAQALATATDLAPKAALLVVTNGARDTGWIQEQLDAAKLPGAIAVDADRAAFREYRVVAFPSVYAIAADRTIAQSTKGFGPLLAQKAVAGARLAAGLLDQKGYQEAVSRADVPVGSDELLKIARSVRMADQLVTAGMLDEAQQALQKVLRPDSTNAEGVALLARVLLQRGRRDDAQPWIERLAVLQPDAVEVRQLRAESALRAGDAEAALRALDNLDGKQPRVALARGKAFELQQRWKEAAEAYRKALEAGEERAR